MIQLWAESQYDRRQDVPAELSAEVQIGTVDRGTEQADADGDCESADEETLTGAAEVCADEIDEIEALFSTTARYATVPGPWATPPGFSAVTWAVPREASEESGRVPQSAQDECCSGFVIICRIPVCLRMSWFLLSGRGVQTL